jgi:hypothetical protein
MLLIVLTYFVIVLHVVGFFQVIATVLKKRLGVFFGLIWVSIGISLLYNIVFNHFWAMVIKPGGPKDLKYNEKIRKEIKNRESRKEANVGINENGTENKEVIEDDRFEGL